MKKKINFKSVVFSAFIISAFFFMNMDVYAQTFMPEEIPNSSYVIGSYVFTREANEDKGYEGKLTTDLIMLASKSIKNNNREDMIIYYKTATGMWINGLNGSSIEVPSSFEIDYTNLKLEEINNTVSVPKKPILYLTGPHNISTKTVSETYSYDVFSFQLYILIDDIMDKTNKVDGVEVVIWSNNDYDFAKIKKDLKVSNTTFTISSVYGKTSEDIVIGQKYHGNNVTFDYKINSGTEINARTYVLDANGKKKYSDQVAMVVLTSDLFPNVNVVNEYKNPEYVHEGDNSYGYRLGIDAPKGTIYDSSNGYNKRFGYYLYSVDEDNYTGYVGLYGINELADVTVLKDKVMKYYAVLGYYDKDNQFKTTGIDPSKIKYYTIDTRTLTAPTLELDQLEENYNYNRTNGDQVKVKRSIYTDADKKLLDSKVQGAEIYEVYYDGITISNFKYIKSLFGTQQYFSVNVKPSNGMASYIGRVYAINDAGKKVYSKYSNVVTLIRTPEINATDINDGKVNVSLKNASEYNKNSELKYKVFDKNGNVLVDSVGVDKSTIINVDENTELYVKVYKKSDETIISAKSNVVTVNNV